MNIIFKHFLKKIDSVFFDDILIYSKNWETHLAYVDQVTQNLEKDQLHPKKSKCSLRVKEVEYLDHIISQRDKVDLKKIQAMKQWPQQPKTLKNLRGFLGFTSYYKRFVKNYGKIATPITTSTK